MTVGSGMAQTLLQRVVNTQPMAVAIVPMTMSSAETVEKRFATRQPTVRPMPVTGTNAGRTHSASLRRNCTDPYESGQTMVMTA